MDLFYCYASCWCVTYSGRARADLLAVVFVVTFQSVAWSTPELRAMLVP